jgi:hypothetical protein
MKRAALVVAVLCMATSSVAQSPKDQGVTEKNGARSATPASNRKNDKQDAATPPNQTVAIYNQPNPTDRNGTNKHTQDAIDVEGKLAKFTKYLVWVGALQFIALLGQAVVFWLTLRKIGKQADLMQTHAEHLKCVASAAGSNAVAAKSSAETAQRQTDALKNIYRAWVLFGWEHGDVAEQFRLVFRNWGQTPAKIELAAFKEVIWDKDSLGGIPKADVFFVTQPILAPSESMPISSVNAKLAAGKEWGDVYSGKKVCVWYGTVQYKDILDPTISHETTFCYWYSAQRIGLYVGGPAEYNKAN